MHNDHASRRGPLATLGLGIAMSITAGVLYAPTTNASVTAEEPALVLSSAAGTTGDDAPAPRSWSHGTWGSGERTPTPVAIDEAAPEATEAVEVDGRGTPEGEPEVPVETAPLVETEIAESVVIERSEWSEDGSVGSSEHLAPEAPHVVHAGPGPVEPAEGVVTLIDPVVIERSDP